MLGSYEVTEGSVQKSSGWQICFLSEPSYVHKYSLGTLVKKGNALEMRMIALQDRAIVMVRNH